MRAWGRGGCGWGVLFYLYGFVKFVNCYFKLGICNTRLNHLRRSNLIINFHLSLIPLIVFKLDIKNYLHLMPILILNLVFTFIFHIKLVVPILQYLRSLLIILRFTVLSYLFLFLGLPWLNHRNVGFQKCRM